MTVFVDASALIALIAGEPGADELADRLSADPVRLVSPLSAWETVAGLCRTHAFSVPAARATLDRFVDAIGLRVVAISDRELVAALDAYARYGKGRHPAALNLGDCFAYACARANGASLLYKGDDFAKTDIPVA